MSWQSKKLTKEKVEEEIHIEKLKVADIYQNKTFFNCIVTGEKKYFSMKLR